MYQQPKQRETAQRSIIVNYIVYNKAIVFYFTIEIILYLI